MMAQISRRSRGSKRTDERGRGQPVHELTQRNNTRLAFADGYLDHLPELDRVAANRRRQILPVARRGDELRVVDGMYRHPDHDGDNASALVDDELEEPAVASLCRNRVRHAG